MLSMFNQLYVLTLILVPFLVYLLACTGWYWLLKSPGRHAPLDAEMYARGASVLLGHPLRQVFALAMAPISGLLVRIRVKPNTLTLCGCALSILAGGTIAYGAVALGGVLGLLGSSLDYLDGRIARSSGKVTQAGNFLDSTLDRYGEIALLSGAAVLFHDSIGTLLACMLGLGAGSVISYTRAKAETLGLELTIGLMQRPERLVLFCMGALCSPFLDVLLPASFQGSHIIFAGTLHLLALLTLMTAAHRTLVGFRTLYHQETCSRDNARSEHTVLPPTAPRP